MDQIYKIIELKVDGGSQEVGLRKETYKNSKWNKAVKAAENIAMKDFEDLLNIHCREDNNWRLDSIQTIRYFWGPGEYYKTVIVLKNLEHFKS